MLRALNDTKRCGSLLAIHHRSDAHAVAVLELGAVLLYHRYFHRISNSSLMLLKQGTPFQMAKHDGSISLAHSSLAESLGEECGGMPRFGGNDETRHPGIQTVDARWPHKGVRRRARWHEYAGECMLQAERPSEWLGMDASRLIHNCKHIIFVHHCQPAGFYQTLCESDLLLGILGHQLFSSWQKLHHIAGLNTSVHCCLLAVEQQPMCFRCANTLRCTAEVVEHLAGKTCDPQHFPCSMVHVRRGDGCHLVRPHAGVSHGALPQLKV
mmetsp:Transcript_69099/g.114860  ORF Transcript_69099/g.114860 Transcript_69099/m.114860 type:complete len:268 (-) Transcript_69099:205-1008(-)